MKKYLFLAMMACVLASCSSDGSRDIQIDEVKFVGEENAWSHKSFDKVSTLFEVVPGKYPISWKLVHDLPQHQNYNVELKLKLRLKKKVNILPEVYEKMSNATYKDHAVRAPFSFDFIDSDGEKKTAVDNLVLYLLPLEDWQSKGTYNKDQMMDFINFLASEPGTEMEVVCNNIGVRDGNYIDCIEDIKNARGIQCNMTDDKSFENSIGHIVD